MFGKLTGLVSQFLGNQPDNKFRSPLANDLTALLLKEADDWRSCDQKLRDSEIGRSVLAADPEEQKILALDLMKWLTVRENEVQKQRREKGYVSYDYSAQIVKNALVELLRKKLPVTEDDLIQFITWSSIYESNYLRAVSQIIKQLQDFQMHGPLSPRLKRLLENYILVITNNQYSDAETRQQVARLKSLAGHTQRNPLVPGEAWSDHALSRIEKLGDVKRGAWIELLNTCLAAKGSTPTAKWQKASEAALKRVGWASFKKEILIWFPLVDKPRTQRIATWHEWSPDPNLLINDHNADILKGLVWTSAKKADDEVLRAITALAISAYKKVPMVGPRCVRVGNACIWALGETQNSSAVGHLSVLKARIKSGSVVKVVGNALDKAAKRADLPTDEVEEMSVPTFGLTEVGHRTASFGDHTAHVSVKGTNDVSINWTGPTGKAIKSTPAAVKKRYPEDLKELNQSVKDIRQMLTAQRDRIDSIYLEQRNWDYKTWRERYLDHPLVGTIARRLIWRFTSGDGESESAIWLDGELVTSFGRPVPLYSITSVELWHPLHETTDDILRWREFLEEHLIRQPFKQAHREIYLLTDAERNTNVYSNRYAAHIVKQHQFHALCAARGWKNKLRLMVDDEYPPATRHLKTCGLRAEFWIEGIGENYGEDTNESGTYLYLSTDQVRFYPVDARENSAHAGGGGYGVSVYGNGAATDPLELSKVPELVLSEIMRDVDLFVGVASIGNDPNWLDTGTDGDRRDYWQSYSFGDLSVSAKSRKEILERLVPKLKIADRCSFNDKFLVVKGDVRTYKIHLGSANILMEPNDQYLCIVPKQNTVRSDNKVFLPFEGDQRLAVIISKALLLAADTKIDDPTIQRQIRPR